MPSSPRLTLVARSLALVGLAATISLGCSSGDAATGGNASQGGGGTGGTGSASSTGGAGGTGGTGGETSGTGAGGAGGAGGEGGEGGSTPTWPTCEAKPAAVPAMTLPEIWAANPDKAVEVWVEGVHVTAISGGGCVAGTACQLFVQQEASFASAAAGAKQALRVLALPSASSHFTAIAVGDRIDLRASVWRHTEGGLNELFFHVSAALPGCAEVVGAETLVPVEGLTLEDLTAQAYEETLGPLFIRLTGVSGKPKQAGETFALFPSFGQGSGGIEEVTSVSPFFLPGGVFVGLTPELIHNFASVTGVFGQFAPPADPLIKYEEIYIRSMDDVPFGGQ